MADSSLLLRVAMIGAGFLDAAHSYGRHVALRFFDLSDTPEMVLLVGRDQAGASERAGAKGVFAIVRFAYLWVPVTPLA